jgi:hypothetical protein
MTLIAQAALFKNEVVKMLTNGQTAAYILRVCWGITFGKTFRFVVT